MEFSHSPVEHASEYETGIPPMTNAEKDKARLSLLFVIFLSLFPKPVGGKIVYKIIGVHLFV